MASVNKVSVTVLCLLLTTCWKKQGQKHQFSHTHNALERYAKLCTKCCQNNDSSNDLIQQWIMNWINESCIFGLGVIKALPQKTRFGLGSGKRRNSVPLAKYLCKTGKMEIMSHFTAFIWCIVMVSVLVNASLHDECPRVGFCSFISSWLISINAVR